MRTDSEFELWLSEVDQRWQRTFRRATWQIGALIVVSQASMFAVLVYALER